MLGVAGALALGLAVVVTGERGSRAAAAAVPAAGVPGPEPASRAPASVRAAACEAGSFRPIAVRSTGEGGAAVIARRPLAARARPGGPVIARFGLRNVNGVRTVFGVRGVRVDAACRPTWYRVQLPIRPNGATGWVRAQDVRRYRVDVGVLVDLSDRRVTVYRDGVVVLRARAAIGKPTTPTPTGRYFVNQRLLTSNETGPWGPGGVGISAFSPVLVDWAQGGPIAIHGTNQPHLIGDAVSNGCVRISNYQLLRLMEIAVEGTPVEIRL